MNRALLAGLAFASALAMLAVPAHADITFATYGGFSNNTLGTTVGTPDSKSPTPYETVWTYAANSTVTFLERGSVNYTPASTNPNVYNVKLGTIDVVNEVASLGSPEIADLTVELDFSLPSGLVITAVDTLQLTVVNNGNSTSTITLTEPNGAGPQVIAYGGQTYYVTFTGISGRADGLNSIGGSQEVQVDLGAQITQAVPEPGAVSLLLMMFMGVGAAVFSLRRKLTA